LLETAGFETTKGRVMDDEYLRAPGYDNVFILGDCSIVMNEQNKPYPPTAQIATQQGKVSAYNLTALIRNEPLMVFKFHNNGVIVSLGKGEAIATIGSKQVRGVLAVLLKKIVDLRYIYTIGGISLVIKYGHF
jgi:NADH dehydrogenase